ncbi:MAG: acyltransferase [Candidatus Didemnitutus sp.]|nr:acyltransferase [Candidatus Didemnitutus sp.]
MTHRYFPSLDGLRTIAVGIVLAAHGGLSYFRSGGVGVDIFFVLSGFLITSILAAECHTSGTVSLRNFYARRFLRLAPALVLMCAFAAAAMLLMGQHFPATEIALSLSYTINWARAFYDVDYGWFNHTWTLAIEEQFYLLWPLVVIVLDRVTRRPALKAAIFVGLALVVAVYRARMVGIFSDERINYALDTRMDSLMTGAALAYLVRSLPGGKLPDRVGRFLGQIVAPFALAVLFAIPQVVTWYSPWMGWIGYSIVAVCSALVIADLVAGGHSRLERILSTRPMVYVGRISYGIYLFHLPVYHLVELAAPGASLLAKLPFKLAVSIGLAAASYSLVEKQFLRLKSRFAPAAAVTPNGVIGRPE